MKLTCGSQKIEGENQAYAYKSCMYSLLSAPIASKQYQLGMCGWMKDNAMKFDDVKNDGFVYRAKWTAAGRTFQFMVPILLDVFMQDTCSIIPISC